MFPETHGDHGAKRRKKNYSPGRTGTKIAKNPRRSTRATAWSQGCARCITVHHGEFTASSRRCPVVHRVEPWPHRGAPWLRRADAGKALWSTVVRRVDAGRHRAQKMYSRSAPACSRRLPASPRRSRRQHGAKPASPRSIPVLAFFTARPGAPGRTQLFLNMLKNKKIAPGAPRSITVRPGPPRSTTASHGVGPACSRSATDRPGLRAVVRRERAGTRRVPSETVA